MNAERYYDQADGTRRVLDGYSAWDGLPVYRNESAEEYTARTYTAAMADWHEQDSDPYLAYIRETGKCPSCDGPATEHNNGGIPDACDLGHCANAKGG